MRSYLFWALSLCILSMTISFSLASSDIADQTVKAIQHARRSHNHALKRAVQIVDQTEKGNRRDLQYLFSCATRGLKAKRRQGPDAYHQFMQDVCNKLRQDQEILRLYQKTYLEDPNAIKENITLAVAIKKLVGTTDNQGHSLSGIYEDSIELLTSQRIDFHSHKIDAAEPKNNQITVLKNVLIYINLMLSKQPDILHYPAMVDHVQLLYPVTFSIATPLTPDLQSVALFGCTKESRPALFIPNAGYVYGGHICYNTKHQARTHGVDCSSLLFWSTYFAEHPQEGFVPACSTKGAAMAWSILKNQKFEEQLQWSMQELQQKLSSSADAFILEHYLPIEVSNLQEGDLVIWRKFDPDTQSYAGHTAMFASWMDPSRISFVGIEATRRDDKTSEGVQFNHFTLTQELTHTYVLRPKTH